MSQVLIEVDSREPAQLQESIAPVKEDVTLVEAKRFDGLLLVQILALLNAATIPILGKIIIERIKANRHVVIKKKGVVVSGLSADNAVKVLQQLAKDD